ncbi:MAG: DUF2914 domain-containing protein [Pseudomonadota bacterium]
MKFGLFFTLILTICLGFLAAAGPLGAEGGAAVMQVLNASICRDVVDRAPVKSGQVFPADVGRLFCLTKFYTDQYPTQATHVWYYGNSERARITLPVRSSPWTTYSSKTIFPHETGDWHVVIFGPDDRVLQTYQFKITALQ